MEASRFFKSRGFMKAKDNQIVPWSERGMGAWTGAKPVKHIPIECWSEIDYEVNAVQLGGPSFITNQGGNTYLVTLIAKDK